MIETQTVLFWYIIIGIINIFIGWIFYYMSWPYWNRKDFWEKYTWVGLIVMFKKIKNMQEPGKTYAKISQFMLTYVIFFLIFSLIILKLLKIF